MRTLIGIMVALLVALAVPAYADSTANVDTVAEAQSGSIAGATGGTVVIDQSSTGSDNANYPKQPVWGAASLMLNGCQEGASGQGMSAGASSAFESATCTQLRLAEAYQKLAIYFKEKGDLNQEAYYDGLMVEAIAKAEEAADFQYYPKTVGGAATATLPVGALIWLLTLI